MKALDMIGLLRFLLVSVSLIFLSGYGAALEAQNAADPIQELAGEWYVKGATTTLTIKPNHIVQHSRWGRGDIKWDNADYYIIKYRDRAMDCHYILQVYSPTEVTFARAENTDSDGCDLGELRRVPSESGPASKHSETVAPHTSIGDAGQKEVKTLGPPSGEPPSAPNPPKVEPVKAKPGDIIRDCAECPEVTVLPGGYFIMGSASSEAGREPDEGPQHIVNIGQFALGRFAVTKKQFAAFVSETGYNYANSCRVVAGGKFEERAGFSFVNPGFPQDDMHPAVCLSWYDALAYVSWLSQKTGKQYRLPSEAEREYATRAATSTPYSSGTSISTASANFDPGVTPVSASGVTGKGTLPVASFEPNAFGLYQMHGNVAEWTQDCWNPSYDNAQSNGAPVAAGDCGKRVLRGGAWGYSPARLRSAYREKAAANNHYFHVGFRVARIVEN